MRSHERYYHAPRQRRRQKRNKYPVKNDVDPLPVYGQTCPIKRKRLRTVETIVATSREKIEEGARRQRKVGRYYEMKFYCASHAEDANCTTAGQARSFASGERRRGFDFFFDGEVARKFVKRCRLLYDPGFTPGGAVWNVWRRSAELSVRDHELGHDCNTKLHTSRKFNSSIVRARAENYTEWIRNRMKLLFPPYEAMGIPGMLDVG